MEVPWRDYVDRIFAEKDAAHKAEMAAAHRALDSAADALRVRLEAMNEFRSQIQEERSNYITRGQIEPFLERLRQQEERSANHDGRLWSLGVGLTIGLSILTIALNLALKLLR